MDNYKPRLYTRVKYRKKKLSNVDPHTHAEKYSNINVPGNMKAFYTNELNKEKSTNFLRKGIIDCDMKNKDIHDLSDNLIIVESSLFDKYFDHFTENKRELKRDEIPGLDFLIEMNIKEYDRLLNIINTINKKATAKKSQKGFEYTAFFLRRKTLIRLKQKFDNWFATHNVLDQIKDLPVNVIPKEKESFKIPIEIPTGTTWNQITITVFDDEHLIIKVPNYEERIDFANAGFADKRAKDKSKWKPNETWAILLEMAESKMIHKGEHYDILSRCKGEAKQRIYKLNQTLRKLVKIDDNPINRYNRKNGGWIPKFNLIDNRDQKYNSISEIEKLKKDLKI